MKKKLVYKLLIAISIFTSACTKENPEPEISLDPKDAPALVSKVIQNSADDNSSSEFGQNYYYDDGNKLIKIIQLFKNYNNGELNQDDKDTINFYYDTEDRLIKMVQTGDNWPHEEAYIYSTNLITWEESYNSGLGFRPYERREYSTNADGKIIKNQSYNFDQWAEEWKKSSSYNTYIWQDGNVISETVYDESVKKSAMLHQYVNQISNYNNVNDTISFVQSSSYNTKINPFAYSSTNIGLTSKNLLVSRESASIDGRYSTKGTISYEYGSNGFPKKSTNIWEYTTNTPESEPNIYITSYTIEYEYIDLK